MYYITVFDSFKLLILYIFSQPALGSNQQQSWWLRGSDGDGKWASSSNHCHVRPEHRAAVVTGFWEEWLICRPHLPLLRGMEANGIESVGSGWFITICGLAGDRWKYLLPTPSAESSSHCVRALCCASCSPPVEGMRTSVKAVVLKGTEY